eukprot:14520132-Alexandrium_andersonii.AAC.1
MAGVHCLTAARSLRSSHCAKVMALSRNGYGLPAKPRNTGAACDCKCWRKENTCMSPACK